MWRRNAAGFEEDARENDDSDESISEEEVGEDCEWTQNAVSLGGGENDKEKGGYHFNCEVETPFFNDGNSSSHYHGIASATAGSHSNEGLIYMPHEASVSYSDEEIISDDEKIDPHTLRRARDDLTVTWSEANREVEALVLSKENACSSSNLRDVFMKEKKSTGGGGSRKRAKSKFSFPCRSEKKDQPLAVSNSNEGISSDNIAIADEIGAATDDEMDNFMADYPLNIHDNQSLSFEMTHKHGTRENSMAEILSGFLEKGDLQEGGSQLEIQKKSIEPTVLECDVSPLNDSIQEDDDLPEALDSNTSFESEDEGLCQENAQNVKIISRTMADQFHEAFRTVSAIDDRPHVSFPSPLCGGIYRKLQQVMQIEKKREMDSLKNASTESSLKDEGMPILVRILSRSLEAKLVVCSCSCVGDEKNSSRENNLEMKTRDITRTMTIIFNPRMSSDDDLEVSNLIRIYPPWKEVTVKDQVVFLCSHFSQVQP